MCEFQGTYGAERCLLQALQHLILHHSEYVRSPGRIPLPVGVPANAAVDHSARHLMRLRAIRSELEDLFGERLT
jgi:hypothetical protein